MAYSNLVLPLSYSSLVLPLWLHLIIMLPCRQQVSHTTAQYIQLVSELFYQWDSIKMPIYLSAIVIPMSNSPFYPSIVSQLC